VCKYSIFVFRKAVAVAAEPASRIPDLVSNAVSALMFYPAKDDKSEEEVNSSTPLTAAIP